MSVRCVGWWVGLLDPLVDLLVVGEVVVVVAAAAAAAAAAVAAAFVVVAFVFRLLVVGWLAYVGLCFARGCCLPCLLWWLCRAWRALRMACCLVVGARLCLLPFRLLLLLVVSSLLLLLCGVVRCCSRWRCCLWRWRLWLWWSWWFWRP